MYFCLHWWTRKLRRRAIRWLCPRLNQVKVKSLSHVWLFANPWTVAYQVSPSMGFSRSEYWSVLPFPSPGDLPDQGSKLGLPHCKQTLLPSEPPGKSNQVMLVLKNPPASAGDARGEGSIPGSGTSPAVVKGNPLQYSCLGNFMDRGARQATVHGARKSRTRLNNWAHTHTPRLHYYIGESRVRPNYFDLEFIALFYDGKHIYIHIYI